MSESDDTYEDKKEAISGTELEGDEAAEFLPHPGYFGETFEDNEEAFGHATLHEGEPVKIRLFHDKEDADRDFEEFPHPHGMSVLFKCVTSKLEADHIQLTNVEVIDVDEPQSM